MIAELIFPFPSLSGEDYISRGSAGQVFAVSQDVVFKCATRFRYAAPSQEEEMAESVERIGQEMAMHERLQKHRHRNIIHSILCIPEGIFMQRVDTTLSLRIFEGRGCTSDSTKLLWIQQLSSGAAWLESMGVVHGDLRSSNVLVDARDDLRIIDFDAAVKIGDELLAASEPFCKLNGNLDPLPAGAESEQFSLGSCFYHIRFEHIPYHEMDAPSRVRLMARTEYPSTSRDAMGDVIQACWRGLYPSIQAVAEAVGPVPHPAHDDVDHESLLHQCTAFLERERPKMQLRGDSHLTTAPR